MRPRGSSTPPPELASSAAPRRPRLFKTPTDPGLSECRGRRLRVPRSPSALSHRRAALGERRDAVRGEGREQGGRAERRAGSSRGRWRGERSGASGIPEDGSLNYAVRGLTDRALSCAPPVNPEDTPAGGRRSCHPTGRPPAGSPRKLTGGGASAAAPCWAARCGRPHQGL
jgi:hypothetical protein